MIKRTYIFLLIFSLLSLLNVSAQVKQGSIEISGKVEFQNPEAFKKYNMVWLYKGLAKEKVAIDSVKVTPDGSFRLKVNVKEPGLFALDILKWQTAIFWSDKDVTIQARGYDTSRQKSKNSGFVMVESKSASTQLISLALHNQFLANQELEFLAEESLAAQQNFTKDNTWLTYLKTTSPGKRKQETETLRLKQLINTNQQNPAVVFLLKLLPPDQEAYFTEQLHKMKLRFPDLNEPKQLEQEYLTKAAISNAVKPGNQIPHIAYKDPNGKVIDVNSFKGKYVLIDFWASWCGPCRKAIPAIKELYSRYNTKGFEVLSVSVDTDLAAWHRAMSEENMPWSQVLSPNKEKTLNEFMIVGIPTLYLVNREGAIVEKYTGYSAKLKDRLEGIFKD